MIAGDDFFGSFLPCFSFLTNIEAINIMWGKDISFGSISFKPGTWGRMVRICRNLLGQREE